MPPHHYGLAVLCWEFVLSPALHWEWHSLGRYRFLPCLSWAPWLKLTVEVKCKWKRQDGVTFHFENLLFSHSGSSDFSLFGPRFLYLFLAWFFLHFLEGLVNGYRWLAFEASKWAKDSLSQIGAEIIYLLVFVQHSSRRPWLGCLVLTETKQNKRLWIAIYIVLYITLKISSRGGWKKDTATENKYWSNLTISPKQEDII